jgi:hypothetical protein
MTINNNFEDLRIKKNYEFYMNKLNNFKPVIKLSK